VEAEFVGHPLAEAPLPTVSREEFAAANDLDPEMTWIGLLPGSRVREIRELLPEMLRAAVLLYHDFCLEKGNPEPQFILPLAPTLTTEQRNHIVEVVEAMRENLTICLVDDMGAKGAIGPTAGGARAALHHARASIVASGTATVEAALIGNPFLVVYRVSPVTFALAKRLVKVDHVAMANLIVGKRMVPELIQGDFNAGNIVQQIEPLLAEGKPREKMMKELAGMRALLHTGRAEGAGGFTSIERVASVALEVGGFSCPQIEVGKAQ
jgi:lipid-A-disaccharide synthase